MTELTRRRTEEAADNWHIYYGDVIVGHIDSPRRRAQ